jgi:hypothetical protein
MLSKEDLKEIEISFMKSDSKAVIKGLLIFAGLVIIFYSVFS